MTPEMFRKLAALGLSHEQMAGVLEIIEDEAEARKEKARVRVQKWRDRLNITEGDWLRLCGEVYRRDGYQCAYCGTEDGPFHVDHMIPLAQGGTNDIDNLTVACRTCNCGKSGRTVEQWRGLS